MSKISKDINLVKSVLFAEDQVYTIRWYDITNPNIEEKGRFQILKSIPRGVNEEGVEVKSTADSMSPYSRGKVVFYRDKQKAKNKVKELESKGYVAQGFESNYNELIK